MPNSVSSPRFSIDSCDLLDFESSEIDSSNRARALAVLDAKLNAWCQEVLDAAGAEHRAHLADNVSLACAAVKQCASDLSCETLNLSRRVSCAEFGEAASSAPSRFSRDETPALIHSGPGLPSLPMDAIVMLSHVKSLDASGNALTAPPPRLDETRLSSIDLSHNRIVSFGDDCELSLLVEKINLNNNPLGHFPDSLKDLLKRGAEISCHDTRISQLEQDRLQREFSGDFDASLFQAAHKVSRSNSGQPLPSSAPISIMARPLTHHCLSDSLEEVFQTGHALMSSSAKQASMLRNRSVEWKPSDYRPRNTRNI